MTPTPPATPPPANPLNIDPEQLSESDKALLELFERRATLSTQPDDVTLTSAEDLEETDTPGSSSSTAASEPPTTVEGPSGGSESAPTTEPSTEPPTPPTTPPTEPVAKADTTPVEGDETGGGEVTTPPATPAFTFAGVDYTPDQLSHAVRLQGWYDQLRTDQVQAIDAMLSGQYVLVPASASVAPPPGQQTQPPTTPPAPPSSSADEGAGEWLDPRAEAEITALRNQITELQQTFQQSLTPVLQQQQDVQLQQRIASITNAETAFRASYNLDDATFTQVQNAVVQAGILPSLLPRHNGDVEAATRQAYEMMFWTTPSFRENHLGARAASDLADAAKANQDEIDRKKKLTALSPSSGGSVPRPSRTPQTKDDRHAGMVELIRADMNGQ